MNPLPAPESPPRLHAGNPPKSRQPAIPDDSVEARFVTTIVSAAGLVPAFYRLAPLVRRIPACLRALRVASLDDALHRLELQPDLIRIALDALLIGTTEFFRDAPVFELLLDSVIPRLLADRPHPQVWSIACSNGAELYSVAMLFARSGSLRPGQFLGTDCRRSAVESARAGIFPASTVNEVAGPCREWFERAGPDKVRISREIRQATEWRSSDILKETFPGTRDLVLCRNLAIYLDPGATEALWAKLAFALAPGGFLVVGKAENPRLACLRKIGPSVYQKICPSSAPE